MTDSSHLAAPSSGRTSVEGAAVPTDTQLIDMLRDEAYDICSFAMPTGQGDADIGWQVRSYHMDTPNIRIVGEAYRDDQREALRQAWTNLVTKRVMDGRRSQAQSGNGSPASKVTRPSEQDAPGSSIGLGAEGEQ